MRKRNGGDDLCFGDVTSKPSWANKTRQCNDLCEDLNDLMSGSPVASARMAQSLNSVFVEGAPFQVSHNP